MQSELVEVEVKTEPRCRVTLTVKAKQPLVQEAKREAVKQVAKEVSIPGFRKGKAPLSILESKYPGTVAKAWDQTFIDAAFKEAQRQMHIPVLNNKISYQVTSLTDDQGEASYQFEREPEIPSIDPSQFTLKEGHPKEVTEEQVQSTLQSIQYFYARWQQVTDRPVRDGDFVILDIDDIDQDPPVQAFSNSRFEVKEKRMADWMRVAVLGKHKDEKVEAVSEADATETEENRQAFQQKRVRIHIKGIEEAILPPVDAELAKKLGVPNVDALYVQLRNLLEKQAETLWRQEQRDAISDQMIKTIPFEIPASMLEREANFRMTQLFKNADFAKKWQESMSEEEKEAKKREITSHAEHAIRLYYLCRAIIQDNHLHVSEEDLMQNYDTILELMFADPNRVNYRNHSDEQKAIEYSKYMMSKAQDFIVDKIRKKQG